MPLPTLTWRAFPPTTLVANTTTAILNAINANFNLVGNYADGTARPTAGTGTAWSSTTEGSTVAVIASPPTPVSGSLITPKWIIAGDTVLPGTAPTMLGVDANAVNRLNVAMAKNAAGPYTNWYNAAPFTSGEFSGYINACPATTAVTYVTLYMWECQEGWVVQLATAAGAASYVFAGGAFLDPQSTDSDNAETDGRLYCITSTGNTSAMSTTWLSSASTVGPWRGTTTAADARFYTFRPGTATSLSTARVANFFVSGSLTVTSNTPSGDAWGMPTHYIFAASGHYAGVLRNIQIGRAARINQTWANGGTINGYIIAPVGGTDNQAAVLRYS
jgi:hypothetical protein